MADIFEDSFDRFFNALPYGIQLSIKLTVLAMNTELLFLMMSGPEADHLSGAEIIFLWLMASMGELYLLNDVYRTSSQYYTIWNRNSRRVWLDQLQDRFDHLAPQHKSALVLQGFATVDADNRYEVKLHYLCPIHYRLIAEPVLLYVFDGHNKKCAEVCDLATIDQYFHGKVVGSVRFSPSTHRQIVFTEAGEPMMESDPNEGEYRKYIRNLDRAILLIENELASPSITKKSNR